MPATSPVSWHGIAHRLAEAKVNIEYCYSADTAGREKRVDGIAGFERGEGS